MAGLAEESLATIGPRRPPDLGECSCTPQRYPFAVVLSDISEIKSSCVLACVWVIIFSGT